MQKPISNFKNLISPVEAEVRSLEGIEAVNSYAREGVATIALRFDINFDPDVDLLLPLSHF
ncbi:MAG: multidrug efflux pump subunit AcrB [Candidatus Azotimanducaceae bacterium]|jgi:multidrug efflux pump subunit AcrB